MPTEGWCLRMTGYLIFPRLLAQAAGRAYEESLLRAVPRCSELPLEELEDWNCCGATAYMSVDEDKAFVLSARNLALAEQNGPADLLAPCSACYLVLQQDQALRRTTIPEIRSSVDASLRRAGLHLQTAARRCATRWTCSSTTSASKPISRRCAPLEGLKVACYYGCQVVRPYATFDDQYNPTRWTGCCDAVGRHAVDWPLKTQCCGGSAHRHDARGRASG